MEAGQRGGWLRDWCSDLAEFEIEAVRGACREWRLSGAIKFPTPGQLLPLVRKRMGRERKPPGYAEPWRPLSDAEYGALSLSEKVRHHRILAAEARRRAGPMWRNASGQSLTLAKPGHIDAAQMAADWRRWSNTVANHESEAKRLSTHLHQSCSIAAE